MKCRRFGVNRPRILSDPVWMESPPFHPTGVMVPTAGLPMMSHSKCKIRSGAAFSFLIKNVSMWDAEWRMPIVVAEGMVYCHRHILEF